MGGGATVSAQSLALPSTGSPEFTLGWALVGSDQGLVTFGPNPPESESTVATAAFQIAGRDLGPGAAMNFRLVRLAEDPMDTCNNASVYGGIAVDY